MTRRKRGKGDAEKVPATFARGFIATALLDGLRNPAGSAALSGRVVLKHALQGGCALAAGTVAAQALWRRKFAFASAATAVGAVGILMAEALLSTHHQDDKEKGRGQEEA